MSEATTWPDIRSKPGTDRKVGDPVKVSTVTPMSAFRADFDRQPPAADWLSTLRERGMARAEALGFPTMKNEDWHFTSVTPISERTFRAAETSSGSASSEGSTAGIVARADLARFTFGKPEWHTLVFVNGEFAPDLSSYAGLGSAVRVGSLARAARAGIGRPERHLGKIAAFDQHFFTALNTAFIRDGAFVEIQPDAVVQEPIHLIFVSEGSGESVSHPRNLIVAARNSRAVVIESYVSIRDSVYLTNAVTEIMLGDGARLDHYKIQRESAKGFHVGTTQVRQSRDSQLHSFSFAVGGALARTNIYTSLDGEAATCTLNGLYLADGTQHIDNQTSIEHIAPNCPSHEVYKGVLGGRSHGVFNGKVYVHPEAQKTDGKQSNNNLLLSPTARIDTKPQLEIFADDVKCTHGATVGRLDDTALFYLSSRGIGPERARTLLTYAFAADVLETIELEPLKKDLEEMVLARFAETTAL